MQGRQTAPKRSLAPSQQPSSCRGSLAWGPKGQTPLGRAYPFLAKEAAFIQKSMGCLGPSPNPSEPRARASRFLPGAATPQAKGRPDRTALINAGASWAQPGTERTGLGSSIGAGLGVGHLAGTGQGHTVPRGLGRSWRSPGTPLGMGVHQQARFDTSGRPVPRPCSDPCKPVRPSSMMATKRSSRPGGALDCRGDGAPSLMGAKEGIARPLSLAGLAV